MKKLTLINVSNGGIGKKGMEALFNCLNGSQELCNGLTSLDVSFNRFDNESSKLLGLFLGKTTALIELNISSTAPSMSDLCARLEKCAPLQKVDLSKIKVPKQDLELIIHFINILPQLQELNLSYIGINFDTLDKIISTNNTIKVLNLSDNENTDEAIIAFCNMLSENKESAIKEIDLSRCFGKKTKVRNEALEALSRLVNTLPITKIYLKGGGKSSLKTDILHFINSLVFNQNVEYLDVSGQQVGDYLAFALRKVLLHNFTIKAIHWDENETTIQGYKVFKFGLEKNFSLIQAPVTLKDILNALKNETETEKKEPLMNLIKEIELLISRNSALSKQGLTDSKKRDLPKRTKSLNKMKGKKETNKKSVRSKIRIEGGIILNDEDVPPPMSAPPPLPTNLPPPPLPTNLPPPPLTDLPPPPLPDFPPPPKKELLTNLRQQRSD